MVTSGLRCAPWQHIRGAMTKLENYIAEAGKAQSDTNGTLEAISAADISTAQ